LARPPQDPAIGFLPKNNPTHIKEMMVKRAKKVNSISDITIF
tara:strand:+ start:331 stop:456 length:126 start_codon:yes stop_codon:yes gene_type:complete